AANDAGKTRGTSVFMTTLFDSVAKLSEQELLDHFAGLVVRDRHTTRELLVAIAEIDERKLWARHACSSMFIFCMERFHMSEQVTAKRLWAARTARRFPVVLEMVARGELHLGAIHLLARHLTEENHEDVLARARHMSSREVERLVAELAPRPDATSRISTMPRPRTSQAAAGDRQMATQESMDRAWGDEAPAKGEPAVGRPMPEQESMDRASSEEDPARGEPAVGANIPKLPRTPESRRAARPIIPLSPRRYKIEITVDEATHDRLRSLQDLLGRSATGRDPAAIISRAIDLLLVRTLARKAACTERPKPVSASKVAATTEPAAATKAAATAEQPKRGIPAAVRREVWQRDCGRCCYVDARGRRCSATSNVEFHHRAPFALGGRHSPENIELRCAAHNQYQADLDFGPSFMDAKRGNVAASGTFPGECRETEAAR
ncbi:MAG: HNH endonuclease, partial [Thioalkalivibrio sp.]|nr:HNH endonuclease [Thioalkalivibrio sp.]